ncbi:MAG: GNAT family N-acetyltransferase [Spirochaetales bacterium]|jgi:ribosomal protein S18 acetylase RimI-like enzyme|nr:GNAT family N-acetyltransferase [Spirochaetales bacterium]
MERHKTEDSAFVIRAMKAEDREAVLSFLRETSMFSAGEIEVARELIDIWLDKPQQKDYLIYTVCRGAAVAGYICFGPTPATGATWDIYWIAVAPPLQGRGLGGRLLRFAEDEIIRLGGRLIIIETSSTQRYSRTRDFYEKNGYIIEARIRDFYCPGDDRLIYVKRI